MLEKPKTEKKNNPHKPRPGFGKWRIVHAAYEGEDEDPLVVHLRSGATRKFVLRCNVDSAEHESLAAALGMDGDTESIIGEFVQMSTNRTGPKEFMRGGPLPWQSVTLLAGEPTENGGATVHVKFDDDGSNGTWALSAGDAERLAAACGDEPIGVRARYRLMPDDTMEFQMMEASE